MRPANVEAIIYPCQKSPRRQIADERRRCAYSPLNFAHNTIPAIFPTILSHLLRGDTQNMQNQRPLMRKNIGLGNISWPLNRCACFSPKRFLQIGLCLGAEQVFPLVYIREASAGFSSEVRMIQLASDARCYQLFRRPDTIRAESFPARRHGL